MVFSGLKTKLLYVRLQETKHILHGSTYTVGDRMR